MTVTIANASPVVLRAFELHAEEAHKRWPLSSLLAWARAPQTLPAPTFEEAALGRSEVIIALRGVVEGFEVRVSAWYDDLCDTIEERVRAMGFRVVPGDGDVRSRPEHTARYADAIRAWIINPAEKPAKGESRGVAALRIAQERARCAQNMVDYADDLANDNLCSFVVRVTASKAGRVLGETSLGGVEARGAEDVLEAVRDNLLVEDAIADARSFLQDVCRC